LGDRIASNFERASFFGLLEKVEVATMPRPDLSRGRRRAKLGFDTALFHQGPQHCAAKHRRCDMEDATWKKGWQNPDQETRVKWALDTR